jgi:hypothetical protein
MKVIFSSVMTWGTLAHANISQQASVVVVKPLSNESMFSFQKVSIMPVPGTT